MQIKTFTFNPVQENTYVVYDETGKCAIIDAGCFNAEEFEKLDAFLKKNDLQPVKLINTHCHFDHIFGIERCREAYNLDWEAHEGDFFMVETVVEKAAMFGIPMKEVNLPEQKIAEGDLIKIGNMTLEAIHVPGHSPGSICFYEKSAKVLISGDVLFKGSIGRTDLPQGDHELLISGIKEKLLSLPEDVEVYPGHGPASTIGDEKALNPFLQ